MKKIFQHTKRPYEKWDQDDYDPNEYDWDAPEREQSYTDEDGEYYAEEDGGYTEEDGEYYAEEDGRYTDEDGEYYAEEDGGYTEEDGEYYAEEDGGYTEEDGEYYAEEDGGYTEEDGEYYAEEDGEYNTEDEGVYEIESQDSDSYGEEGDEYYAEEEPEYNPQESREYDGEILYEEDPYYREKEDAYDEPVGSRNAERAPSSKRKKQNGFVVLWEKFLNMETMDKIITCTGVAVLILALVAGGVYVSHKNSGKNVAALADVGNQLTGISTIGEKGLLAVADARIAKLAAAEVVEEPEETTEYDEEDYSKAVTVKLNMTSVMKDLKIKFTNQKTGKLISNVPFTVTITTPDGKTETWSDDDMDGIIYKKKITPGEYSVEVNELTGEKYSGYTLPTGKQKVEVKKDIAYEKIDVSDEVKTEAEIDVSKEDTSKNDTVVESTLQDTVQWVESTAVAENYTEVAKSTIVDPATKAVASVNRKNFTLLTGTSNLTVSGGDAEEWKQFTMTLSASSVTVTADATVTSQATVSGASDGKEISYSVSSDNAEIAAAAVDAAGKITVTGKKEGTAKITVVAKYTNHTEYSASQTLTVTVTAAPEAVVTLDKTTATVLASESITLTATVKNEVNGGTLNATSSNTGVATVAVKDKTVTVTGVAAGDATITVSYTANNKSVTATCVVKVKEHPKNDKTTKLTDKEGHQLYVLENEKYREAVYADYYTATKFFIKGDTKYTGWQTIDGKVYFFKADGEKVTGEQVIQGAKYNFASDGSLVTGNGTMGIDVSKWNGTIDWNAVKNSGVSYVIIRCGYRGSSQGSLIIDPKFDSNIKGATAAGLKVGVYFFTQAVDEVEALEEASFVLDKIKNYKISYPVFLDVESSGGRGDGIDKATRTAVCKTFCETIKRAGYNSGVYANKTWFTNKIDAGSLSAYKIWLAQYAATPTYTGRYDLWQYKSTGKVSGISGNVDLNLSYLGY